MSLVGFDHWIDNAPWSAPLVDVPPSAFEPETYVSRWNVPYCIDAMLEHAVMHPIRHAHQLEVLMTV